MLASLAPLGLLRVGQLGDVHERQVEAESPGLEVVRVGAEVTAGEVDHRAPWVQGQRTATRAECWIPSRQPAFFEIRHPDLTRTGLTVGPSSGTGMAGEVSRSLRWLAVQPSRPRPPVPRSADRAAEGSGTAVPATLLETGPQISDTPR